ncbi:methylated-DNA--[protein]-cysteine S-methyltransferase [Streptomyces millisiae]|uniref:Methylated-DNA--protein-cysteine methyltransferase n=1 Tax=Streptomyces millisiae TaxID=3075542 RepID=A0ABU2LNE4_9ACTN|nr:methylated-DNA--[protein]-cysteine S-methyltransferase [Streptomyces sp. DSM 44918]MDT0319104.1 methylated-DNA--[protein]-cysteine S-methyltransferase [Streptomyces sp. DSM 44918]
MSRDTREGPAGPEPDPRPTCAWSVRETPIGPLLLAATERGLVLVVFHADDRAARRALARLEGALGRRPVPAAEEPVAGPLVEGAWAELDAYFAGRLRSFDTALDWSLAPGFTGQVLRELAASVPFGGVVGYGELADRVGDPGAARAVGAAMGANPLPVIVPCHRVLAADGGIGGFGGGLETKRALLALEGVLPAPLF